MTGNAFGDFYILTAMGAVLACVVIGVVLAIRSGDDLGDLMMLIVVAILGGVMAGAAWPLTALVVLIAGPTVGLRKVSERRRRSREAAERKRREAQREAFYNPPESDTDKFRRYAKEQRQLEAKSRRNGWDDVADMQAAMAEQYEQMAKVYQP